MSLTVVSSGTITPGAIGTPNTLLTDTPGSPLLYVFEVDTSALAAGEEVTLQIKKATLSGGTRQVAQTVAYRHVQSEAIKKSIPWECDATIEFILNQTVGTARAFPWKVWHL